MKDDNLFFAYIVWKRRELGHSNEICGCEKKKKQQQQQPRKQKQEQTLKIVVSSFHLLFTDRHLAIQTVINGVHKDNKT